LIYHG